MKYKKGDKLRVREDLKVGDVYGDYCINREMAEQRGKVVTIEDVKWAFIYIKECDYVWTAEMFSGLAEEPINLMPLIAKELGVEMGEEFKISNKPDVYKFTEDRLIGIKSYGTYPTSSTLFELITGKENIIKLPKLSEDERAILRNLPKEYKHIKRSKYDLYVYDDDDAGTDVEYLNMFSHLFQFIKWGEEPYNIEELLKGE